MKRILSLGLASAMVMSMGAAVSAKTNDAVYPIGGISTNAYLYDSDDYAVDLSTPVTSVDYGETLYYPLLNAGTGATDEEISDAQDLLDEKTDAFTAATTKKANADAALAAANAWQAGTGSQSDYNSAVAAYDSNETPAATEADAVTQATGYVSAATAALTAAEQEKNDAQDALDALTTPEIPYVYESEAVDGLKVKAKWDMNGNLIDDVEIAKKKVMGETLSQKYIYFVEVSLKDSVSVTAADISGVIQLRKSGEFDFEDMELDVNMELAFPYSNDNEITEDLKLFKEGYGFEYGDSEEFTFECDDETYFEVNTNGQGKILLSATSDFDSDVALVYPNANLDFFYGNGASFNRIGTLYLHAEDGSYLYQLRDDGRLVEANAEYDEYDECFVINTRTLGKYVISDVKLPLVDGPIVNNGSSNENNNNQNSGTVDSVITNPSTGASL